MQVLYSGRAPRIKETLPDFLKWHRVTRHPLVFRGLTGSQRTSGFWGVTNDFMKEVNNVMTMYYSALYTLSNSNYGRIYQDKSFIEISDECRKIAEIIEPQKLDRIEIPTNYILSLEDDIPEEYCIQRIDLLIFRGNSLIGNSSQNNTRRKSFQKIR